MAQIGYYEAAIAKRAVYVRVHGLASMNNCLCVRDFLEEVLAAGHTFIVVDLGDCSGMDSTFMGVLAGAATFDYNGKSPGVAVVNAGEGLLKTLRDVGLNELLFIETGSFEVPALEFVRLDEQPSEEKRLTMIHAAHSHLIKISDENEKVFGPLLAVLEAEMQKRGLQTE